MRLLFQKKIQMRLQKPGQAVLLLLLLLDCILVIVRVVVVPAVIIGVIFDIVVILRMSLAETAQLVPPVILIDELQSVYSVSVLHNQPAKQPVLLVQIVEFLRERRWNHHGHLHKLAL